MLTLFSLYYFFKIKFLIYLSIVAAKDDTETQRNGIVLLVWFESTYKISYMTPPRRPQRPNMGYESFCCVRVTAIHVCTPDTPAYRFRRSIMAMRVNHGRSRLKFHVGKCTSRHTSTHIAECALVIDSLIYLTRTNTVSCYATVSLVFASPTT